MKSVQKAKKNLEEGIADSGIRSAVKVTDSIRSSSAKGLKKSSSLAGFSSQQEHELSIFRD